MAVVTPTDRPKSVRNRGVIGIFDGVIVVLLCFGGCSICVGFCFMRPSQISSFFFNLFFFFSEALFTFLYIRKTHRDFWVLQKRIFKHSTIF